MLQVLWTFITSIENSSTYTIMFWNGRHILLSEKENANVGLTLSSIPISISILTNSHNRILFLYTRNTRICWYFFFLNHSWEKKSTKSEQKNAKLNTTPPVTKIFSSDFEIFGFLVFFLLRWWSYISTSVWPVCDDNHHHSLLLLLMMMMMTRENQIYIYTTHNNNINCKTATNDDNKTTQYPRKPNDTYIHSR